MRVTFLRTSPGAAPGLLTRDGWRSLEAADVVLTDDPAWLSALAEQGLDVELVEEVPAGVDVTTLETGHDAPGSAFMELVAVMDRLREDCPWDREQTHRSLARYLLEETYETLEAIESGDRDHLREELGDLLLQVCFHARIASEDPDGGFDVDDVARDIADKLVYRHPHVFAGLEVADAAEVDRNWEALKATEKKRDSPLDGIPPALPALAYADKVLGRLVRSGLVGDVPGGSADLGARLLGLVAEARATGLDPEQELRDAVRRLIVASSDGPSAASRQPSEEGSGLG